ncbi:hypothetical protein AVEN_186811-1 [Araneus ventricosus]|uniref:Uncharacterized protein n=1 Tax=Araneus ventricosus TaxID=182803 RepID=A0A4Y2X013_ARAVE|nr:hypothetical protein AVEN_175939-1 [Araneus ventricosus]GBO42874.1 hypothetical protein AVEN_186811-1 [Araneus ventricosus]
MNLLVRKLKSSTQGEYKVLWPEECFEGLDRSKYLRITTKELYRLPKKVNCIEVFHIHFESNSEEFLSCFPARYELQSGKGWLNGSRDEARSKNSVSV